MAYKIEIDVGTSVQSVQELKVQIDALKKSLEGLDTTTEEYSNAVKQMAEAQKQLAAAQKDAASNMGSVAKATETATQSVKKTGDESKKVTDNFKLMRDEIKQLRSDFAGTTAGTQEYDTALLALSNKMRDFNDMNKMIKASAADTGQILTNITGTAKGIAGGFEAAQGALELFGVSSEKLKATEQRTMAIIKVVQGLSAAEDGLTKKLPYLVKQYQALSSTLSKALTVRKASKAATDAETVSDTAQAAASKTAAQAELQQAGGATTLAASETAATGATMTLTGAVKALGAAIKANPLGLILGVISSIIAALPLIIGGLKKLFGTNDTTAVTTVEELNSSLDKVKEKSKIEFEIKKIKAGNLDPVQEAKLELEGLRSQYNAVVKEYNKQVENMLSQMANASGSVKRQLEKNLREFVDTSMAMMTEMRKEISQAEAMMPVAQAKKEAEEENKAAEERKRRNEAAAAAYAARTSELSNFVKELTKATKTETQLENEEFKKQEEDLKDSLKRRLIDDKQYATLHEQLEKDHNKRLEDIRNKAAAEAKKLSDDLEKYRTKELESADPLAAEENRYQEETTKIIEFFKQGLISYEQFQKDLATSTDRYLQNKDKLNANATNVKSSNIDKDYNNKQQNLSLDYDKLIEMSNNDIEKADLAMEKENAMFELKKKKITEQIALYKELSDGQLVGSKEYQDTLETISGLESQLTTAEKEHAIAVIKGEEAKQQALQKTEEDIKAQVQAWISGVNDIVDKISELINIYAEEAKERAANENLSMEARKKAFEESKKYQVAQTIISTLQGIVAAWSSAMQLPPPANYVVGAASSALITAIGAANIAKINSQQLGGGSASSLSSTSSTPNIGMPTYNSPEANINAQRPMEDVKVYVLEQDISEKQDTARVRVAESTF